MHLNTIIKHWPDEQSYSNRWTRATRAAEKALGRKDINAKTEVTEEEMRRIIRAIPSRAAGVEEARYFLTLHGGFPVDEWVRICDVARSKIKGLEKEFREDMDQLDQVLEHFQSKIKALEERNQKIIEDFQHKIEEMEGHNQMVWEDLEEKNEALEKRLDQIAP